MKTSVCLLLFVAAGQSQTAADPATQITSDLIALSQAAGPSQNEIIGRYRSDVLRYEIERHRVMAEPKGGRPGSIRSFVSQDQADKVRAALAGKDLSSADVAPLTQAILQMVDSAVACHNTSARPRDSEAFRASAGLAWIALRSLGVDDANAGAVMDALLTSAIHVAEPSPEISYK
jgi:hypothetical protein